VRGLDLCARARAGSRALRKEIEQLQRQLQSLSERLQRLEARPALPPLRPPHRHPGRPPRRRRRRPSLRQASPHRAGAPAPAVLALPATRGRPAPVRHRNRRRFVGNLTQSNVEKAQGGTFAGQENRFFPREVELSLFGQVDPYAYAEVRIEAGEERRGEELNVKLAEAYVTLLTLPLGTQAKFGQMRNRLGYSNVIHEHDLAWIDRPNVLRNFLGAEGLQEKGVELTIVPDLPFYLEGLVGVFNGDNETAFGRSTLQVPLFTGRLRTFLELGNENAVQLGMSVASGETTEKQRDTLLGWEGRYKYRPEGWLHPLVTLTGEAIYSLRHVLVGVDTDGNGLIDLVRKRERDRFGWYLGTEAQPFRRWAAGVRYDWSEFPVNPGKERSVEPYITFWPSEFLRFRLAYKNTDRTHRESADANGGSAKKVDEVLFQGTFILGAHPAHPF